MLLLRVIKLSLITAGYIGENVSSREVRFRKNKKNASHETISYICIINNLDYENRNRINYRGETEANC